MLNQTVVVTIDCTDVTCLKFLDSTAAYSASNTGGYGTPNVPELSAITSVTFTLTLGSTPYEFEATDSAYFPNAAGTNEFCLLASDFDGLTEFTKGATYTLEYAVNVGSTPYSVSDSFLFACCGAAITSNLATNFSITELIGCTSIKFTDTTGSYDAEDNTGGYGAPNPAYANITETLIRFTFNDGTVKDITTFIPTEAVPYITINGASLGFGDNAIPSQVVSIEYSVYQEGLCRIGFKEDKVLFRCQLENCIASKSALLLGNNYCDGAEIDSAMALIWKYNQLVISAQENIDCVVGEAEKLYKKCSINFPPCG